MTIPSTPLSDALGVRWVKLSKSDMPEELVELYTLSRTLERANAVLVEALEEIQWQCEGRVDINGDGGPNLAMVMDSIARAALAAQEKP